MKPASESNLTASSGRFKMHLQMFAKKSGNENLVQIEYENGYLIDLGWYPEYDSHGELIVQVIKNYDWESDL
ncbi:MAG: hypothetical protein K2N51_12180 [Lachnospiraceae bacterium]|nr:hypothetical protein [Lachnospiraceae bacterium]